MAPFVVLLNSNGNYFGDIWCRNVCFFTRSLDRQLNRQLLTLAQAAAPSLETVENEGLQSLNQELPWRELFQHNQSLEWFDTDAQLLAREGNRFSTLPLNKASQVI